MTNQIKHYDAIVIGTGQGGKPLAVALANAGWNTAVIERLHAGGNCVNVDCTANKTMVVSARVAFLLAALPIMEFIPAKIAVNLAEMHIPTLAESLNNPLNI